MKGASTLPSSHPATSGCRHPGDVAAGVRERRHCSGPPRTARTSPPSLLPFRRLCKGGGSCIPMEGPCLLQLEEVRGEGSDLSKVLGAAQSSVLLLHVEEPGPKRSLIYRATSRETNLFSCSSGKYNSFYRWIGEKLEKLLYLGTRMIVFYHTSGEIMARHMFHKNCRCFSVP
ncbi:hypothetical protein EK904_006902, partial [Melospiza melodia maxima]